MRRAQRRLVAVLLSQRFGVELAVAREAVQLGVHDRAAQEAQAADHPARAFAAVVRDARPRPAFRTTLADLVRRPTDS